MRAEPRGQGFERGAKAVAERFRLDPQRTRDGSLTHAQVDLPIAFDATALESAEDGKPVWTQTPDVAALQAAFASAKPKSLSGRAVLSCQVEQGGDLSSCSIVTETPAGAGLGQTAMALQTTFKLATWSDEGLPVVGERVRVPMRFEAADPPSQTSAPAPPPGPAKPTPAP